MSAGLDAHGPVYVDELALSYLQSAHVLDVIANRGVDIRVHPNVRDMANALVEAGDAGDDLANEVEGLVAVLREGMESGAVSLLPQLSDRREKNGRVAGVGSLEGLVLAAERCQALCVDDRYMNSHPVWHGADWSECAGGLRAGPLEASALSERHQRRAMLGCETQAS